MQIAWAIGLMLLAALSYVIPDWRILQLAVSVPTAITVLYIWYIIIVFDRMKNEILVSKHMLWETIIDVAFRIIPESPRWLLAKGKITEADMAVERITKYNVCCTRLRRENVKTEANISENATPVKPERKSRVSCADLKKSRTDSEMKEEAANLLNSNTDAAQQKVQSKRQKFDLLFS